jgi:hypothetical protein
MRQALHEYRDEASQKVREYRTMARGEGWLHRLLRRLRGDEMPATLVLSENNLKELNSWRERKIPSHGEPTVTVTDDPTRADDAKDIRPLEERGLDWRQATRQHRADQ